MAIVPFASGFQISQSRSLPCSHSRPSCVVGAMWWLSLWIADWGDCRAFFEQAPLPKARARSLLMRATTDVAMVWLFCAFHGRSWTNYKVGQIGRPIYTTIFRCQVVFRDGVALHVCIGEALHRVHCRRSYAAITTPETETLSIALLLFLTWQGGRCFWSLFCHNLRVTLMWHINITKVYRINLSDGQVVEQNNFLKIYSTSFVGTMH